MRDNPIPRVSRRAGARAGEPAGRRASPGDCWPCCPSHAACCPPPAPPPPTRAQSGRWEDVSGETFLRRLMSMSYEETRWWVAGWSRERQQLCLTRASLCSFSRPCAGSPARAAAGAAAAAPNRLSSRHPLPPPSQELVRSGGGVHLLAPHRRRPPQHSAGARAACVVACAARLPGVPAAWRGALAGVHLTPSPPTPLPCCLCSASWRSGDKSPRSGSRSWSWWVGRAISAVSASKQTAWLLVHNACLSAAPACWRQLAPSRRRWASSNSLALPL